MSSASSFDCDDPSDKKGEALRSSLSPTPNVTTDSDGSHERNVLASNEIPLLAMLQNRLSQHCRSISQEPHRKDVEASQSTPGERCEKQVDYLERRRKNNDSARRSREVRRQREALNRRQVEMLEKENMQLRAQIALLRLEVSQLSFVLLTKGVKLPS